MERDEKDRKTRESARRKLEALLIEGLESGEPIEINEEYMERHRKFLSELSERGNNKRSTES